MILNHQNLKNIVIRNDYENVLKEENNARIVYADPPYTRYHYSRYYHVLETIALRDFPEVSKSNLKGKQFLAEVYIDLIGINQHLEKSKSN
jgi:adenine-specific DNA methylase